MYPYKCTLRNEIFYNNYFQINKINSVKISFEMCKNILSQSKYYRRCAISIKHTQRITVCRVFYMEFNFARKFDIKKCYLHDLTDQLDAS